jgi:hypothetical protein
MGSMFLSYVELFCYVRCLWENNKIQYELLVNQGLIWPSMHYALMLCTLCKAYIENYPKLWDWENNISVSHLNGMKRK